MKHLLVLLFIGCLFQAQAQITFQRTYGGASDDRGHAVEQTADGGYIVTGLTKSYGAGGEDVLLMRLNEFGDTLWTKTFGSPSNDRGRAVKECIGGGFIIVGTTAFGPGPSDVYLLRTDDTGDLLWSKTFGGLGADQGWDVQQTSDTGFVIVGDENSFGNPDVYLVKTDAAGTLQWTKTFGGSNLEYGRSVEQTNDGGYIICGTTQSYGPGLANGYVIKTDVVGDPVWTKTFGGTGADYGLFITQTTDGGYLFSGYSYSFGGNLYVIKTDSNGDEIWSKDYGNAGLEQGWAARPTFDGGFVFAGGTSSFGAGTNDVYVVKTDSLGDTLWTRAYGGLLSEYGYCIQQTADSGFIIIGYAASFGSGLEDIYLIKTDAQGYSSGCNEFGTNTLVNASGTIMGSGVVTSTGGGEVNPGTLIDSVAVLFDILCDTCIPAAISGFIHTDTFYTATFFDTSSNTSNWFWDFGDGNTDTVQNPVHTYVVDSIYYVCLVVSNFCGTDTFCDSVNVICPDPVAGFSFVDTGLTITFTDTSAWPVNWFWDFGDGNTDTVQNPVHTYPSSGTYYVCLYVSSVCGTDSICDSITVIVVGTSPTIPIIANLILHPNPTTGEVRITNVEFPITNVEVFDVFGRAVPLNFDILHSTFSIQHSPPGIYFVKIGNRTQKLVLNK